jgi:hypothetical protein
MLARDFALEAMDGAGHWQRIHLAADNYQRLVKIPLALEAQAIRCVPLASWGGGPTHVMAFEVS